MTSKNGRWPAYFGKVCIEPKHSAALESVEFWVNTIRTGVVKVYIFECYYCEQRIYRLTSEFLGGPNNKIKLLNTDYRPDDGSSRAIRHHVAYPMAMWESADYIINENGSITKVGAENDLRFKKTPNV